MAEIPLVLVEMQFSVQGIIAESPSASLRHGVPAPSLFNDLC